MARSSLRTRRARDAHGEDAGLAASLLAIGALGFLVAALWTHQDFIATVITGRHAETAVVATQLERRAEPVAHQRYRAIVVVETGRGGYHRAPVRNASLRPPSPTIWVAYQPLSPASTFAITWDALLVPVLSILVPLGLFWFALARLNREPPIDPLDYD